MGPKPRAPLPKNRAVKSKTVGLAAAARQQRQKTTTTTGASGAGSSSTSSSSTSSSARTSATNSQNATPRPGVGSARRSAASLAAAGGISSSKDQTSVAIPPTTSDNSQANKQQYQVSILNHPFQIAAGPGASGTAISQSSTVFAMFNDLTRFFRIVDGNRLLFYNDTSNTDFIVKIEFDEPNEVVAQGSSKVFEEIRGSSNSNNNNGNITKIKYLLDIVLPGETQYFGQGKGIGRGYLITFGHRPHARVDPTMEPLPSTFKFLHPEIIEEAKNNSIISNSARFFPVYSSVTSNFGGVSSSSDKKRDTSSPSTSPTTKTTTLSEAAAASSQNINETHRLFRILDGPKKIFFFNDTSEKQYSIKIDFEEDSVGRKVSCLGSAQRIASYHSSPSSENKKNAAAETPTKRSPQLQQQEQHNTTDNPTTTSSSSSELISDIILPKMIQPVAEGDFGISHFTISAHELSLADSAHDILQEGLNKKVDLRKDDDDENEINSKNNTPRKSKAASSSSLFHGEGWDTSIVSSKFVSIFAVVPEKLYRIHDGDRIIFYNDTTDTNFDVKVDFPATSHVTPFGSAIREKAKRKLLGSASPTSTPTTTSAAASTNTTVIIDTIYAQKTQLFCKGDVAKHVITVEAYKKEIEEPEQEEEEEDKLNASLSSPVNKSNNNDNDIPASPTNPADKKRKRSQPPPGIRKSKTDMIDAATFDFHGPGPMHLSDSSRVFPMFEDETRLFRIVDTVSTEHDDHHHQHDNTSNSNDKSFLYFYNDTMNTDFVVKIIWRPSRRNPKITVCGTALDERPKDGSLVIVDVIPPLTTHCVAENIINGYRVSFAQRAASSSSSSSGNAAASAVSLSSSKQKKSSGKNRQSDSAAASPLSPNSKANQSATNSYIVPSNPNFYKLGGPYGIPENETQNSNDNDNNNPSSSSIIVFDCFEGDGMLFRCVVSPKMNKWYFYNDTVDAEMHINVKFFKAKSLRSLGTATVVHSSDAKEDVDLVTDIILPGETLPFVEAEEIHTFTSNFSAKSVSALNRKKMKERAAPLLSEDRARFAEVTYGVGGSAEECMERCCEELVTFIDITFPPTDHSLCRPAMDEDPGFVSWIRPETSSSSASPHSPQSSSSSSKHHPSSSSSSSSRSNKILLDALSSSSSSSELPNSLNFIAPCFVRDSPLGNNWLSCAIAALASFPDFIKDVFACAAVRDISRRKREQFLGIHRISLIEKEWWTSEIIDDFLPCVGRSLCCVRHAIQPTKELWCPLLEKIFARMQQSYAAITAGDPLFVFSTITGFPTSRFDRELQQAAKDPDETSTPISRNLFSCIRDASNCGNIIIVSTKDSYYLSDAAIAVEEHGMRESGLELDRSYQIIAVRQFTEENLMLVKVRVNTWSNSHPDREWKGRWSIYDKQWLKYPEVAKSCGVIDLQKDSLASLLLKQQNNSSSLFAVTTATSFGDFGSGEHSSASNSASARGGDQGKEGGADPFGENVDPVVSFGTTENNSSSSSQNNNSTNPDSMSLLNILEKAATTTTTNSTSETQQQQHSYLPLTPSQIASQQTIWLEWRELLKYCHGGGICYSNRNWTNFRVRSRFNKENGTSPLAFRVFCKRTCSVIFTISQPGLPKNETEARGGRPFLSVSLALLSQEEEKEGKEEEETATTQNENENENENDTNNKNKNYSVTVASSRVISLPTSDVENHLCARHVGFKYEFVEDSKPYYVVPHCNVVLPTDEAKALQFSLCCFSEPSSDSELLNLDVQFVQVKNSEKWFVKEQQSQQDSSSASLLSNVNVFSQPVESQPVDEDYQCKRSGQRPTSRHGWNFQLPN